MPCVAKGNSSGKYAEKAYPGRVLTDLARVRVLISGQNDSSPDKLYGEPPSTLEITGNKVRAFCGGIAGAPYDATFILP